jgi:Putative DNA-binding domain/Eco57I restriction-modification methylase
LFNGLISTPTVDQIEGKSTMSLDFQKSRQLLQDFLFSDLFIEILGWSDPGRQKPIAMEVEGETYYRQMIAELSGVGVFEITAANGQIPGAKIRAQLHQHIEGLTLENLLIFVDQNRACSLWYWVKREGSKLYPRDHIYVKGQPGDLFLGKISALVVDFSELRDGLPSVVEVAQRLQRGLDVERVTKKFFEEFKQYLAAFVLQIEGIDHEGDRRWYASVILNRLMFVYFLQRKQFVDHNPDYLQDKFRQMQQADKSFYHEFLLILFFQGFGQKDRPEKITALIGDVRYLNGGLFLCHRIEQTHTGITIENEAFEPIFNLFQRYSWHLDDTPGGKDDEINPSVLGYIFEKYINQKEFGAYYTRPEITEYLCDRTINKLILDRVGSPQFDSIGDLLLKLDAPLCHRLLFDILPSLSILDPACGSGAFLVAAMRTLITVYSAVIGRIKFLTDLKLTNWLKKIEAEHPSLNYYIKKRIITDNLYGVDIMEEATEIAKLRLFLALVASAQKIDDLEPLPNVDFNIMAGNSLIGLIRVDGDGFDLVGQTQDPVQGNLLQPLDAQSYQEILKEKNDNIELYKKHSFLPGEESESSRSQEDSLLALRNEIDKLNRNAQQKLNQLLLGEFSQKLGIKYEEAQLTGRPKKRLLNLQDIATLEPFHWGYHFDQIIGKHGGFDVIIANPPWEVLQTNEKEFFQKYSQTIQKKKLRIEDWKKQKEQLLEEFETQKEWLSYESGFPHQWAYFKKANHYRNQISIINGKTIGSKPNLYSLFIEQCFNLLKQNGECGFVVSSGIYSDLGTKRLREMLFEQSQITGLISFENRKTIFEGVDSRYKFVVLTLKKGGKTTSFPAIFQCQDVGNLQLFPDKKSISLNVDLIRNLSPESLSIREFSNEQELNLAIKLMNHPFLADEKKGWGVKLYGEELNMTRSQNSFYTIPTSFPVYEGEMIWHFNHTYSAARYWVEESELRSSFLGKRIKRIPGLTTIPEDLKNDYEVYRIAMRKIARSRDTRTLISTIIPPYTFAGNSLSVNFPFIHEKDKYNKVRLSGPDALFLVSLLNSFVVDHVSRSRVNTNLNLFHLYELPLPRLREGDPCFSEIVERAAKLICTTSEFDNLAQEVGLNSHQNSVTDKTEREKLQAELDGMIAHLYELTEEEFTHILSTFPLVAEETKQAALEAYRAFVKQPGDQTIAVLIANGESATLEFKSTVRWDLRENKKNPELEKVILKTIAAFLNSEGGTLLTGVADDGTILGLQLDYQTFQKNNRDGYELFLTDFLLKNNFGHDCAPFIQITFHELEGKDICRVVVKPSPRPIYVKDGQEEYLFIRANNSTRKLNLKEAVNYCKTRWG